MTEKELAITKRIAEIEGIKISSEVNDLTECYATLQEPYISYNPFDWSILGPLMFKYKVEPAFWLNSVTIEVSGVGNISVDFNNEEDLPMAILECIIKSQEK